MSIMKWKDTYSVGVEEIDNQHKGLVSTLNELFDAMSVGQANDILGNIINKMIRYAVIHFETEEKYFDEFDYALSDEHKDEHDRFKDEVQHFKVGFDAGNIVLSMEVFKFLKDWLINHMMVEDQKYKQCFQENGLK